MANNKLVNAENLQTVVKGVYDKTQSNLNTAKGDLEGKITKETNDRVEATTFNNGITTVNSLGGIGANVSLDGKSVTEILDMLLFPYVKQTISGSNTRDKTNTTLECGDTVKFTKLSATVTKKSKPITKVEFLVDNAVVGTIDQNVAAGGTFTYDIDDVAVTANVGTGKFKVRATDENGSVVSADAGTAITFVYPYYYGVANPGVAIDEALVESLTKDIAGKGQKVYSYNANNQRAVIAYPAAHGNLKSALDPNAFENIAAFTKHEVKVTGRDGKEVNYYVYVSGAFTGQGFKYTFKHN